MADEKALLDSGATENFINEITWQRLGIGRKELSKLITVTNVDGCHTFFRLLYDMTRIGLLLTDTYHLSLTIQ
jgi:predicted aspartyl protease